MNIQEPIIFADRQSAAQALIPLLEKFRNQDCVVVALPRGGVVLGYHVAKEFDFPLEIVLTKKIGHPSNKEFAIGVVSLENEICDHVPGVPVSYFEQEIKTIRNSLKERNAKFMKGRKPVSFKNKIVIIIDDGIATGNTIIAAIQLVKMQQPFKIVVATPVIPTDTAKYLANMVDELLCVQIPFDFVGVGQFYDDFSEVTDEVVINLLNKSRPN